MNAAKIRWGLIGCGDIARKRVAPALRDHPNCELVAVSRARFELAESFAKEFSARRWYDTWEELISDEEVDAVYIATPVHLHAAQTIASARAGKHVLCEKPMAMNVGECDQMIAAGAEHQVRLGVSYYRHFYPVVSRVRQILASGEIGTPVLAQINAFEWFNPDRSHPRRWLTEKQLSGGGPMFDFGCHRIEVLMNLFGRVSRISSLLGNSVFVREVEDTTTALLEFESGAQATLCVTHAASEPQDTLHIFGTEGSIHVPELNAGVLTLTTSNGERHESYPAPANLHLPLIDDFVQALISNRDPQVDGAAGREVAKIEAEIYSQGVKAS
jgi:predicted dehydrogenase